MGKKVIQRQDGEKFELPRNTFLICCDCRLYHRIKVVVSKGKIYMQAWRDGRRTANARRNRQITVEEGGDIE